MNIAQWTIEKNVFSLVLTIVLIIGGVFCYTQLGMLEDPEFAIKDALVTTLYPGASAKEVAEEVTEVLETAIQELGQLKRIKSMSRPGVSTITVTIKDKYDKKALPQIWDELRRKVNDAQSKMPPNAGPSIVADDYGDVYGVLYAVSGKGFTYKELDDITDFLKRELLLVQDVAKATIWGLQQEQIFVEISRARLSQLGISLEAIYQLLSEQNFVTSSGDVRVGEEYIRISPSGSIKTVAEIENLLIKSQGSESQIYLKDIAKVTRGYISPPTQHLRYNQQPAIALGFSTVSGGNVIVMGDAIKHRLKELEEQIPLGIEIEPIYFQADMVIKSVNSFIVNLIEALVIVIVVLMIFMGLQSGILIGIILLLTVCATFVFMYIYHIDLQRISLGALIIALGMLVDNAIVVTEGMLIRIQQGMNKIKAANEVVSQTMWPLFGATVIAILAFAAIGLSQDSTGEYTRSLFQVLLISLGLSWIIGITITPLLAFMFLNPKKQSANVDEAYKGFLYVMYQQVLVKCLRHRSLTIGSVVGLLMLSIYGFGLLEESFFPDSTSQQFYVHYWLPEGTDIRKTSDDLKKLEKTVLEMEHVKNVSTFVGGGAPRYMLVYSPEKQYDSYGMLLIEADDYQAIDGLIDQIRQIIKQNYLDVNPKFEKVRLGPGGGFLLEARFQGHDPDTLRMLAKQSENIMREQGNADGIRNDWRNRVKLVRPMYSETKASRIGLTRVDISDALQTAYTGRSVGLFREGRHLIPIISRAPDDERGTINNMQNVQVWSKTANQTVPLRQAVDGFDTAWEDSIIHRRNKKMTITAQADPRSGNASVIFEDIKPKIEAIELPVGYELEWGGEFENSRDAQVALKKNIPPTLLLMILVTIALFNSLRQPLIIWLTVPLAVIGVSFGLLLTNLSFGFMALLGFLSLSGMLIKNAIVLIDEIDTHIKTGKQQFQAIVDASVSRLRPVSMAAITTILGMIPLLSDVFFVGMAVTIMSGLLFATVLTLIIVPVFYATFFGIKEKS